MDSRCNELPWPDLAAYFNFKTKNGENIVVACKLCPRGSKTLSANVKASSNLRKHLQLDATPDSTETRLPKHERCAAHTLNLVATADADRALEDAQYKRIYTKVIAKCKAVWNKQQQSSIASEVVKKNLGRFLLVPCPTRWNSLYRALEHVRQLGSKIKALLDDLNLPRIVTEDLTFLEEYTSILQPVVQSLDILQGEKYMYMGVLLPTLWSLQRALHKRRELQFCRPLLDALKTGVAKRKCKAGVTLTLVVQFPRFP
ncbi:uncharacterized protein ISCGN_013359 [Ixodes scapularis]